ncbi:hypothetical protein HJC23_005337 [Cyclotella cryptica]|uniref:RNB domain-containing protein n=1 Tax=Cyclotella cryptica TaxID=29204 RepID=A0ABD3PEU9_9STRA
MTRRSGRGGGRTSNQSGRGRGGRGRGGRGRGRGRESSATPANVDGDAYGIRSHPVPKENGNEINTGEKAKSANGSRGRNGGRGSGRGRSGRANHNGSRVNDGRGAVVAGGSAERNRVVHQVSGRVQHEPKESSLQGDQNIGQAHGKDSKQRGRSGGHKPKEFAEKSDQNGASAHGNVCEQTVQNMNNKSNNHRTQTRRQNKRNAKQDKASDTSNHNSAADMNDPGDKSNNGKSKRKSRTKKTQYEPHQSYALCLQRYNANSTRNIHEPTLIRGKIRVMPAKNGAAFVTCDRGSLSKDVLIADEWGRNRALDGDYVFVELLPGDDAGADDCVEEGEKYEKRDVTLGEYMETLELGEDDCVADVHPNEEFGDDGYIDDVQYEEEEYLIGDEIKECKNTTDEPTEMWHDDEVQMKLWDPVVNLRRKSRRTSSDLLLATQRKGKVICIIPPKSTAGKSELTPADESYREKVPSRTIVGTLSKLPDGGNKYLLSPNNKALPRFLCPPKTAEELKLNNGEDDNAQMLYKAEYIYGSWSETHKWPPCTRVTRLCGSCNVEDETKALLVEHDVDHGEFLPAVLHDVDEAVKSGRCLESNNGHVLEEEMGWKPTEEMCRGRRDYRKHRVFTIDPTTARDLDDALHITQLPDGRVEIGVHIADVSHFVKPGSAVDEEALRRATTVYLVDRVIPMLPRPLCEIACSLNENVERLAFSCVWKMNIDGTVGSKNGKSKADEVWYGRTVIKSCSRLDYATAQNIIDNKVAIGEKEVDETLWPKSRQPTGGHTIDEVAADVRLMHKVAMARRKLRFENGALALNGIKLSFQLEEDGVTPKMCAPYPLRDSNRLIEEYMLLANFLVAQRLITHAKGRALLRQHSPPLEAGLQNVVEVSKESFDFDIDVSNSKTLQESLSRLSRTCSDELVIQCVTESLMTPMRPAEYIAAGEVNEEDWQHFALNIPYYTHFTSPIRRYADVIVHRLLQATLDNAVNECASQQVIHADAMHCNDKRMASKKAQERSDRVFLSLFLKKNPISSVLGVCLGIGEKTFTVFVPSLGLSTRVFLDEHADIFDMNTFDDGGGRRKLVIRPKSNVVPGMEPKDGAKSQVHSWTCLNVGVFTKLNVGCFCKDKTPIDVKVMVVGPWVE